MAAASRGRKFTEVFRLRRDRLQSLVQKLCCPKYYTEDLEVEEHLPSNFLQISLGAKISTVLGVRSETTLR